jgi:hypothetical protein
MQTVDQLGTLTRASIPSFAERRKRLMWSAASNATGSPGGEG